MNLTIDVKQIKEDIADMKIVTAQAYRDMVLAKAWYEDRSEKLKKLEKELQVITF